MYDFGTHTGFLRAFLKHGFLNKVWHDIIIEGIRIAAENVKYKNRHINRLSRCTLCLREESIDIRVVGMPPSNILKR